MPNWFARPSSFSCRRQQEAFADQIGWDLDAFFESEERAFSEYSVEFLKALCRHLDIQWIAALP
jgi:hypothetical protein